MKNTKVLEMINEGRIEELKELLRDEIYADALKNKPGAKQRYAAMKKYFGYVRTARESCQKPCMIEFEGGTRTSFCNSYSLALTTEPCGEIELFTDIDRYPNVGRLVQRNGLGEKIDIGKVLAEAKSKGYKLTKAEVNGAPTKFMMRYKGGYFRLGLLDATHAIIDDGGEVTAYRKEDGVSPLTFENDIGTCLVLPVKCDAAFIEENEITVIDI
jgi:hypothetical protein